MLTRYCSLMLACSAGLIAALLTGCQANIKITTPADAFGRMDLVEEASPQADAELLGRIKALAGTWEVQDEKGQWVTASVFTVTSGGSVVRETMFPGTPHEMTNMYSMDGTSLILTHYCAMGNQPRMRCEAVNTSGTTHLLAFEPVAVTNWREDHQGAMGRMTLEIRSDSEIAQQWEMVMPPRAKTRSGQTTSDHNPVFVLRKKQG
jgi:hypothetical protein